VIDTRSRFGAAVFPKFVARWNRDIARWL
jgi:hypothetical protein